MLIGEVSRRSGVSTRMLRHYDRLGLVHPTGRTSGGYREYSPADFRRIFHVEGLRTLGLSLAQIARALDDPAFTPSSLVGGLIRQAEQRLDRERELLERLHAVEQVHSSEWTQALQVVALLNALRSGSSTRRQQAALTPTTAPPIQALAAAALTETDPNAAGALRWALARAGGEAAEHLASGLRSGDTAVRRRAVRAVAAVPGEAALALLTEALSDDDPDVRRQAGLAVGGRGAPEGIGVLVQMVIDGTGDVEAAEVLGALAAEHEQTIMAPLSAALGAATTAQRRRLAQALAELPVAAARPVLEQLTGDDDPSVALTATAVLRSRAH